MHIGKASTTAHSGFSGDSFQLLARILIARVSFPSFCPILPVAPDERNGPTAAPESRARRDERSGGNYRQSRGRSRSAGWSVLEADPVPLTPTRQRQAVKFFAVVDVY